MRTFNTWGKIQKQLAMEWASITAAHNISIFTLDIVALKCNGKV